MTVCTGRPLVDLAEAMVGVRIKLTVTVNGFKLTSEK